MAKTKDIVVDFRRKKTTPKQIKIMRQDIELDETYKYLVCTSTTVWTERSTGILCIVKGWVDYIFWGCRGHSTFAARCWTSSTSQLLQVLSPNYYLSWTMYYIPSMPYWSNSGAPSVKDSFSSTIARNIIEGCSYQQQSPCTAIHHCARTFLLELQHQCSKQYLQYIQCTGLHSDRCTDAT